MLKFSREQISNEFGSTDKFDERVKAFAQALTDHAFTENKPAPTEHAAIERVVREFNSQYIFEDEPDPTLEAPKLTLDQRKSQALEALAAFRWSYQNAGKVTVRDVAISTDPGTLNQLVAALIMAETVDWKVTDRQFVTLSKRDVKNAIRAIRTHVQLAFNAERETATKIIACRSHKALDDIDITGAFHVAT